MYLNYFFYKNNNHNALKIYKTLTEFETLTGLDSNRFDYTYILPEEKADHPDDFESKSISKENLKQGLNSGIINSFCMSNENVLDPPGNHAFHVRSKEHGGVTYISIHFPEILVNGRALSLLDDFVCYIRPEYGFRVTTGNKMNGISYTFGGKLYKNEISGFLISKDNPIKSMRMIYELNYLTKLQLEFAPNGTTLRDFILETLGEGALTSMGNSIYKLTVAPGDLVKTNDTFGRACFLASWSDEDAWKRERDTARRLRRGW